MDEELKRILDEQKDERKMLEMRFLDAQQDLKRSELIMIIVPLYFGLKVHDATFNCFVYYA